MGRCEFPQPESFSVEGGQTGLARRSDRPYPEGAVRPAWLGGSTAPQNSGRSGFRGGESSGFSSGGSGDGGWSGESTGGQFARRCSPHAEYGDGRSRSYEMKRRDGPRSSIRGFGPPPVREGWFPRSGFRGGVRGGSFGRKVLTPLLSKWLGTGFTLLVLTPVLSRLFAHVLVFEFQVEDLKNIWLIDSGGSRHMTGDKG
jgi:hypothetical protein